MSYPIHYTVHSITPIPYLGIVLIAINPYQEVPLYAGDVARAYSQLSPGGPMDPHVFAVSEEARRRMSVENRDQSIIVTGESGAGKTVSACYVMRYFADVTAVSGELSLENRVLACNPLLEVSSGYSSGSVQYTIRIIICDVIRLSGMQRQSVTTTPAGSEST